MKKPREESEIFKDLERLAASPGYVHAVAHVCNRDNVIRIEEGILKPSDMERLFSRERLIRTEISTLIGLMAKSPLDLSQQSAEVIDEYVERTDALMKELHGSMSYPMFAAMFDAMQAGKAPPDPWRGPGIREPIFYGSESAYPFQYRDFVPQKYGADDDWLVNNMGFSASQARAVARGLCALMDEKGTHLLMQAKATKTQPQTWLPMFEFEPGEVAKRSGVAQEIVEAFFRAFLYTGTNAGFRAAGDFNEIAARPLLPTGRGTVLLFSHYAIYEALYESPFFWMWEDKGYRAQAAKHRGAFTEQFAARRLAGVFGSQHVHSNVNLFRGKDVVGEADVLVVFGDRLIIVQAKAKKLTIAARKGNDSQLQADFAAAIQDSYDQGWSCANDILGGGCRLVDDQQRDVSLPSRIKEVFLFSLVSEHYPALALQAAQWLKSRTTDVIRAPFVMDVFLLDTLTEMLATPLRFLSYAKLRATASDRVMSGHELTVLGYHLRLNLWVDEKNSMMMLDDSIAQDLDTAMLVRRESFAGDDTPKGILTKMRGTRYESLIRQIEARADPATLELGFHLLAMDEEACVNVHRLLEALTRKTLVAGKRHDGTLSSSSKPPTGICFHCNPTLAPEAVAVLEAHCAKRKYRERAQKWFGVSVGPDGGVQFGVTLDFPWAPSKELDELTADMKPASAVRDVLPRLVKEARQMKVGRNDPCPCGSGLKYKKCCLA